MAKKDNFIGRVDLVTSRTCYVITNLKRIVEELEPLILRGFILLFVILELVRITVAR